ncbi:Spx/MgsR family RNA polymerase-binding regulatory protein [Litorivicinus sp.]|nr:Spx/MgsR family RNA polymerase-binding regulatory protein [Litorivicinus sp.]MDB9862785.1 Spx/MgsR family RNA polymerase-binding regulatory protein [Litorivicinus sp.]MDC1467006.1 Spx/MgsR family RNA polymerase-binding regulatory protein [Litorivicinus sp.]
MGLIVYGIKNCDSMKKAFQWLNNAGIMFTFIDFKQTPPTADQISTWLSGAGDNLVNNRSRTYRQLPDAIKMDFAGPVRLAAIVNQPSLIKRPLLVNGPVMTVGFDPNAWIKIPNLLTN